MKLFGEYLIEKNIVSTEQMVAALIRQTSELPGMAEIAYNKKLLRPDQLFKIFKVQNSKQSGFIEAATELNIWNTDLAKKFDRVIEETRKPLVQILMDMEITKMETITHALDDFLGDVQDQIQSQDQAPTPEPVAESVPEPAPIIAEPVTESPVTENHAQSKSYDEYCALFTEERKNQIENYLTQLQNGGISISVMNSLKENVHELVTAARTATANLSYSVLHGMESMMEQIMKTPATNINEDFITRIGKVNLEAIQFLWQVSEQLKAGANEEELLTTQPHRKTYETIAAAVEITRFDLDFLA